jgi:hypothetical protein
MATIGREFNRMDDFWRYDIALNEWEEIKSSPGAAKPQKRSSHTLAALSEDLLLLIGGMEDSRSSLSDVWTYRISTNEWQVDTMIRQTLNG